MLPTPAGKMEFLNWFGGIDMPDDVDWLVVADFNLIRRPEDRNKEGANPNEMFAFNEAISRLGLIELPLHGRHFTWTNKQFPPLLERLDWFFTSNSWTSKFPNSLVKTLVMETSDHWPCVVEINTSIPQASFFRFENFWLNHEGFPQIAVNGWSAPDEIIDPAKKITTKFKNLRKNLRIWMNQLPGLKKTISNIKLVLNMLETLEHYRDLSVAEWNFRNLVSEKLVVLLKQQKTYWKQRGKIRWVKEGDASTRFFHNHATIRHRKNNITCLKDSSGNARHSHEAKAEILWVAFKERVGKSEFTQILYNLDQMLQPDDSLHSLETPFTREEVENVVNNLPNNKSPGPDGFTNEFIKGCWPLIKEDFFEVM